MFAWYFIYILKKIITDILVQYIFNMFFFHEK